MCWSTACWSAMRSLLDAWGITNVVKTCSCNYPGPSAGLAITASISSFVLQPLSRKASAPAPRTDARDVAYIVSTTILVAGHLLLIIRIVAKAIHPRFRS